MPDTLDVTCPNCEKMLKVPTTLEGKRVKCKGCNEAFTVRGPAAAKAAGDPKKPAPAAAKGAAKPAPAGAAAPAAESGAKPVAPPPAEKPKGPFLDDEEDEKNPNPFGVIKDADTPRCPHCAKELDPPDAAVCLNCGFNNRTRALAETKKVWAPEFQDWFDHLMPGGLAALLAIGLIVFDIVALVNMRDWMAGSFLEKDDKNPLTGEVDYVIKPGAFIALIWAITIIPLIPASIFAFKRLAIHYRPEEKKKK